MAWCLAKQRYNFYLHHDAYFLSTYVTSHSERNFIFCVEKTDEKSYTDRTSFCFRIHKTKTLDRSLEFDGFQTVHWVLSKYSSADGNSE
jgi:hypothetical protein